MSTEIYFALHSQSSATLPIASLGYPIHQITIYLNYNVSTGFCRNCLLAAGQKSLVDLSTPAGWLLFSNQRTAARAVLNPLSQTGNDQNYRIVLK